MENIKMQEVRHPYKPKLIVFVLSIAFFAICAVVLSYVALTNDKGLILNRSLRLSESGADIFYWCLTGASIIFVLFGTLALIKGSKAEREVLATQEFISAPKNGLSNKIITINYSDITDLRVQTVQKQRFLSIFHSGGKLSITQNMLPNEDAFEELMEFVASKVDG